MKRRLLLGRKVMTNLDSILKSRDITLPTKVRIVKAMVFPVVRAGCESWMWDHVRRGPSSLSRKPEHEGWALKNWWFQSVVLEKTLEDPLDCKEIKPVYPKGNQPWIVIGRTDAKAEAPILWPPVAKSWLIGKDPDAGKDWGKRRRGWQGMRWLDSITDSTDMNLSKVQ